MREEINDLILVLADLKERMAGSKHPHNLQKAYEVTFERLKKLYELEEQLLDIKYKTPEHEILHTYGPVLEPDLDNDVHGGVEN